MLATLLGPDDRIKAGLSDGGKYIEEFGQLINHMIGGDYGEEIQVGLSGLPVWVGNTLALM